MKTHKGNYIKHECASWSIRHSNISKHLKNMKLHYKEEKEQEIIFWNNSTDVFPTQECGSIQILIFYHDCFFFFILSPLARFINLSIYHCSKYPLYRNEHAFDFFNFDTISSYIFVLFCFACFIFIIRFYFVWYSFI